MKGFCSFLLVAIICAAASNVSAQVYRCETPNGVVYADYPCGETAEEIVIDVVQPATPVETGVIDDSGGLTTAMTEEPLADEEATDDEVHTLSDFSKMLVSQREDQIGEIDQKLTDLKARVASDAFKASDATTQARLLLEISDLENSRQSIMAQYDSLIAEAERRAE